MMEVWRMEEGRGKYQIAGYRFMKTGYVLPTSEKKIVGYGPATHSLSKGVRNCFTPLIASRFSTIT